MTPDHSAALPVPVDGDAELATAAALGDRAAFAELVRRCGPGLHRYAVGMLDGDVHEAQDVVQESMVKAWVGLPSFRHRSSVRTWLFRITANEALAARRRRRPVAVDDGLLETLPASRASEPERRLSQRELSDTLRAALSELPWRQRAAWILREVEQMPYAQIAIVLETSEGVVRGQLHRARRTITVRMEQWR